MFNFFITSFQYLIITILICIGGIIGLSWVLNASESIHQRSRLAEFINNISFEFMAVLVGITILALLALGINSLVLVISLIGRLFVG